MYNQNKENGIGEAMAELLSPKHIQKNASVDHLDNALNSLQKAAEIFEDLELFGAADAVTKVMEKVPETIKNK